MIPRFLRLLTTLLAAGVNFVAAAPSEPAPDVALAAKVREIVGSESLGRDAQEQAVADAVRAAIAAAVEGISGNEQIVNVALRFAVKAAAAAPQFSSAIIRAVADVPAVAGVKSAVDKIAAAVGAAAKAARAGKEEFGGNHDDVVVSPSR